MSTQSGSWKTPRVAENSNEYIYFMVKVYVDEYGVLSTYAQTYQPTDN